MQGVSGKFEAFSPSGRQKATIYYNEDYNIDTNTSTLTITSIGICRTSTDGYWGYPYYLYGNVSADGTAIMTMAGSHRVSIPQSINVEGTVQYNGADATASIVIPHNADGTKSVTLAVNISDSDTKFRITGSYTLTLTTIPRASTITATNADLGGVSVLSVTRYSNQFVHRIAWAFGSLSGYIDADGNAVDYYVDLSAATIRFKIPAGFATQMAGSKLATCYLEIRTYLGDTQIGETKTASFAIGIPDGSAPTVTASIRDVNENTLALTGDSTRLVRYASSARVIVFAEAKQGATITKRMVNDADVGDDGIIIQQIDTDTITVGAVDSRGLSTTVQYTLDMVPYVQLTVNAAARRTEPTTGEAILTISGNWYNGSFGAVNNSIGVWYRIPGEDWVQMDSVISGNTYRASASFTGFNYQKDYRFDVWVNDSITTIQKTVPLMRGIPVANWGNGFFHVNEPLIADEIRAGMIKDATNSTRIQMVKYYDWEVIGSGSDTQDFLRAWLRRVCMDYDANEPTAFVGQCRPNGVGFIVCTIYNTSDVIDGLPRYSGGLYIGSAGTTIVKFGTSEGTFYGNEW